jgi:hypothetical protein
MFIVGPVDLFVRVIAIEPSAFDQTSFYPTVFVQALYVPVDHFYFTFGGRLRAPGQLTWNVAHDPAAALLEGIAGSIRAYALPFLERFRKPIDLAVACEAPPDSRFSWRRDDIHVLETAAYSWFLAGNSRKAIASLERIRRTLRNESDERDWVRELGVRTGRFLESLRTGREVHAREQLLGWTEETARALGLAKFRESAFPD